MCRAVHHRAWQCRQWQAVDWPGSGVDGVARTHSHRIASLGTRAPTVRSSAITMSGARVVSSSPSSSSSQLGPAAGMSSTGDTLTDSLPACLPACLCPRCLCVCHTYCRLHTVDCRWSTYVSAVRHVCPLWCVCVRSPLAVASHGRVPSLTVPHHRVS